MSEMDIIPLFVIPLISVFMELNRKFATKDNTKEGLDHIKAKKITQERKETESNFIADMKMCQKQLIHHK